MTQFHTTAAAAAHAPVSAKEERRLLAAAARGDRAARDRLVLHNLRLVIDICRRYTAPGADLDDLVQEGTAGLIEAIGRFDLKKKVRFATYAHWWIRRAISRFVKGSARVVRVPEYLLDRAARVARAREAGVDCEVELARIGEVTPARLADLERVGTPPVPLGEGADAAGAAPACPASDTEGEVLRRDARRAVAAELTRLPGRDRHILLSRYGGPGRRPRSYREVAHELSLSPERTRQLERRALTTLRGALGLKIAS